MDFKRFFFWCAKKERSLRFITTSEPDEDGQYGGYEDICYEGKKGKFGKCAFTVYNYEILADGGEDLSRCEYEVAEDGIPEVLIRKWSSLVYEDIKEAVIIFARKNKKVRDLTNLYLNGKCIGWKFAGKVL